MIGIYEHGIIAMLKLSDKSASSLESWCQENKLPCLEKEYLHCTILFSRGIVEHLSDLNGLAVLIPARIAGWRKFKTALVLELYSPRITLLHEWMIRQGGTHDFPEYIAHTSITYDWKTSELPTAIPNIDLEFDQILIKPINPNYSIGSSS